MAQLPWAEAPGKAHRKLMTTAQAEDGRGDKHGYGLSIPPSDIPMVGHGGAAPDIARVGAPVISGRE